MTTENSANSEALYTVPQYTQLALKLCIGSYLVLVAMITWHWMQGNNALLILGIKLVPLLIFFPGMMRKQYRTFSWLCFVMLAYFSGAVLSIFHPIQYQPTHWVQLFATVVLFNGAMMYSRWRQVEILAINQSIQADVSTKGNEQTESVKPDEAKADQEVEEKTRD
ncbi:MAG: DUF2069 domain-containing protein [Cellvibrionaceae bacterium]